MKKLGFAILSLACVMLVAGNLEAEGPKVWTGEVEMPFAYRSGGMTSILQSADTEMDFVLAPLITLNMEWELEDKVSAFLQIETARDQDGFAADDTFPTIAEFGGGEGLTPAIEQAYIKVEEFLGVDFKFGIQDLSFALRKGDGAFFLDVSGANDDLIPLDISVLAAIPVMRDAMEFAGLTFDYGSLETGNLAVCVLWGVTSETRTDAADADDKHFGVGVDYKLSGDDRNKVQVLVHNITNAEDDTNIMTIGAGADYFGAVDNLEIYGEFYTQSGDFDATTDQSATALRVGGRYSFQHDLKPYVDLSMWQLSGDQEDWGTDDNSYFLSFENVNSTLILEDNLFGLDLDNNYTAIKVEGGIETEFDINGDNKAEPVEVKLLFGQFTLANVLTGGEDALGTEIDISAVLHYTENLTFALKIGMLSGADFFDDASGIDDTDSMTFFSFGAGLKF